MPQAACFCNDTPASVPFWNSFLKSGLSPTAPLVPLGEGRASDAMEVAAVACGAYKHGLNYVRSCSFVPVGWCGGGLGPVRPGANVQSVT